MSGEKTEKPTDKKLEDAAEKGQLPQRKNVLETATMLFAGLFVAGMWKSVGAKMTHVFEVALVNFDMTFSAKLSYTLPAVIDVFKFAVIFAVGSGAFVLVLNLYLNKFNFAPKALAPKFEKLNPINGFKQIFSMSTLYNFFRLLVLFISLSSILYLVIAFNIKEGLAASRCGITCLAGFFPPIFFQLISFFLMVLVILAVIDFRVQSALHIKQNKMSKDDVKREHKGSEGDPMIKSKRLGIAFEDAFSPGVKEVTHVVYSSDALVAMRYEKATPDIPPFVIMKAKDDAVPDLVKRFQIMGAKCLNLPTVAVRFHLATTIGNYVGAAGSMDAAKILHRAGDL